MIQWIGTRINTLLWDFTEYYWENDPTLPNNYFDLYNEYSSKYIAPQISNEQILSNNKIGVHLYGRSEGEYYSPIIAWDDGVQKFAGIKVNETHSGLQICLDSDPDAADFYFAIMQDVNEDDELTTVETITNATYGITMKMVDYPSKDKNTSTQMDEYFSSRNNVKGLLETNLSDGNYPKTSKGLSLKDFYEGAKVVDHLFIQSTYNASGYYEFDSTQNFASLKGNDSGNFTVYEQLGTHEVAETSTVKHGQFLPYNDINPGVFSTKNPYNLYSALSIYNRPEVGILPESDPRKYEKLYLVEQPNFHFAMEMEASFIQTPNGHDAWGHDIIYEFTGDDDFWLYVDGELIIDLGGTHSALEGKVNFCTGEVYVQGLQPDENTTVRDLFYRNYLKRNPGDTTGAQAYVNSKFELNAKGQWVFKDYTTHDMRIFFMERGGGASNLHMRFNLASVKEGYVELSKELRGIENVDSTRVEFPYQIYYKLSEEDNPGETDEEKILTPDDALGITVKYKGTDNNVTFKGPEDHFTIDGIPYENVFLLKPGQTAEIKLPANTISYRIVECGVNTDVFSVDVNEEDANETLTPINERGNRKDFSTDFKNAKTRSRVMYINTIKKDALRNLYIRKTVYNESAEQVVHDDYNSEATTFGFRLSFKTENSTEGMVAANRIPYYIKDENGNYCEWNVERQIYVAIKDSNGHGITNYDDLTEEQKERCRIQSSFYGAVAKIPALYTIEVRDLFIGTQYMVEEREAEIPKGYSRWKYVGYDDIQSSQGTDSTDAYIQDTIVKNKDPLVSVYNLKGYGINVTKVWTDEDYVQERDPTYFAIYLNTDNGLRLLDEYNLEENQKYETVYQLPYKSSEIYWYLKKLVTGTQLSQYEVREVKVENPVVNDDGKVTSYTSVTPIQNEGKIELYATLKGSSSQLSEYTVTYQQGSVKPGTNVREDTVINSREGIIIKKVDMNGNPLANAEFTLKGPDGNLIGTYTSGIDGVVTTAYLVEGDEYTLEETKSPFNSDNLYRGYFGVQSPIIICIDANKTISVDPTDELEKNYVSASEDTITIQNRVYHFQAVKVDGSTQEPVSGARFTLHKKKKVGTWTGYDFNPEVGYENLSSNTEGIINKIDTTLLPGSYELREIQAPGNYKDLTSYIHFTISPLNVVTLDDTNRLDGVNVTETIQDDGSVLFTLIIPNEPDLQLAELTIEKRVTGDMGDRTKPFTFTLNHVGTDTGTDETITYEWTKTDADHHSTTGNISAGGTFTLADGELIKIYVPFESEVGITEANENYTTSWQRDLQPVVSGNTITATITESQKKATVIVTNHLDAVAPTNFSSRHIPYMLILLFGFLLMLIISGMGFIRRNRRNDGGPDTGGTSVINITPTNTGPSGETSLPVTMAEPREPIHTVQWAAQPMHSNTDVQNHVMWRNSVWVEEPLQSGSNNHTAQRGYVPPQVRRRTDISCPQAKLWMNGGGDAG